MSLFIVSMSRAVDPFPVSVLHGAKNAEILQESDGGIDVLAWRGENPAELIYDAVSFARDWGRVHGDDVSASLLVRVVTEYANRCGTHRVNEWAHVGDIIDDGEVILGVSDSRVWEALNASSIRFV
jgi:hypothetical protein